MVDQHQYLIDSWWKIRVITVMRWHIKDSGKPFRSIPCTSCFRNLFPPLGSRHLSILAMSLGPSSYYLQCWKSQSERRISGRGRTSPIANRFLENHKSTGSCKFAPRVSRACDKPHLLVRQNLGARQCCKWHIARFRSVTLPLRIRQHM